MPDNRTLSMGWMLGIAGTVILLLCSVTGAAVSNWARTVEQRGIDNQAKVAELQRQYSEIRAEIRVWMAASQEKQQLTLDLLKEHMGKK